jgi:hypothetical protein
LITGKGSIEGMGGYEEPEVMVVTIRGETVALMREYMDDLEVDEEDAVRWLVCYGAAFHRADKLGDTVDVGTEFGSNRVVAHTAVVAKGAAIDGSGRG